MKWLIGESSRAFELTNFHWKSYREDIEPSLFQFIDGKEKFLSQIQCKQLFDLTYLNSKYPFGKRDLHTTVGIVSTNEHYNRQFEVKILQALDLIKMVSAVSDLANISISKFIPLADAGNMNRLRKDGSGKSCHWLIGAVFLSLPVNHPFPDLELALNIVHELGHQVLMRYQDGDQILSNNFQPVYSAIRKVSRPAIMSFHALVAIYFMHYFFSQLRQQYETQSEELIYIDQKIRKLTSDFVSGAWALKDVKFSRVGLSLYSEMISPCNLVGG